MEPRRVAMKPDWLGQKEPLPWSWVSGELTSERNYWLVTARAADGHPQARPVWGLWGQDRILLSLIGGGVGRVERPDGAPVTVHCETAARVVIVEGRLVRVSNPRLGITGLDFEPGVLSELIDAWNAKYEREWTMQTHGFNFAVEPRAVLAWREDEARYSADASGKWLFD